MYVIGLNTVASEHGLADLVLLEIGGLEANLAHAAAAA